MGALIVCALSVCVSATAQEPASIELRYASFDPLVAEPTIPANLRSEGAERLWIVQFHGTPTQAGRDAVARTGAELHGYLPDNAYVVRMQQSNVGAVRALGDVRWVGRYHAAYRLDPELIAGLTVGDLAKARYNMVVVDKHNDKPALGANITALGGTVEDEHFGSLLYSATLTPAQLVAAAHLDEVLWIDVWGAPEVDMDNARIQGGGNYVESQAGYTGTGVSAHIYEGIEAGHQDFTGAVISVRSSGAAQTHGHATGGIVFGNGTSNPAVRGMAPDAGKFYTTYTSVQGSRWQVNSDLVNIHNVSVTTASWGDPRTFFYTSVSADTDDIIFDHNISWTQSQSNAGNQDSRPQAWAKNVFSIGGVFHGNNSNPLDDSWGGGGSTGPAQDGRIKPTLAAYYDGIGTSDRTGSAGYSSGNWYSSFGGTSGATPIVCGHNVLAIEMFTDDTGTPGVGKFNNPLRSPGASSHVNRPHFTTLKALQVASSSKYAFQANNNRRQHVGWGFPNLQTMWDDRDKTLIVDETDVLTQGQMIRYDSNVAAGEDAFKAVLHYNEPAANPASQSQLINNLSLKVTAPDGTVYWGNNGLEQGNWSVAGGAANLEDDVNPIECVFVQNPQVGLWHVDVIATSIVMDNHVETGTVDADFGLVVTGGTAQPSTSAFFVQFGQGCPGTNNTVTPCSQLNPGGGPLNSTVASAEYGIIPINVGAIQIESFDLYTRSTGGTQVVNAAIYNILSVTPLATTTMTVGPTAGFYTATFNPPVPSNGAYFIAIDGTGGNIIVPNLTSGATGVAFSRPNSTSSWTFNPSLNRPAYSVACTAGTVFDVPDLDNVGNPVLGTSYDITLSDALESTGALLLTGFSDSLYNGTPLPAPLPNAPGCDLLVAADSNLFLFTSASGTASSSFAVPNDMGLIGLELFHQWAVLDAANTLGLVVSDAGKAKVGT